MFRRRVVLAEGLGPFATDRPPLDASLCRHSRARRLWIEWSVARVPASVWRRPARTVRTSRSHCVGDFHCSRPFTALERLGRFLPWPLHACFASLTHQFIASLARPETSFRIEEFRVKHPFTITYSVLSCPRIPYTYANRPGVQGACTGAQHETNVTASVRHCAFINGRTGACPTAPSKLELAARSYRLGRGMAAKRAARSRLHAARATRRPARRHCKQCAHATGNAA